MAKCELILALDKNKDTYHPGERVRGTLEVHVDDDVKCNGLKVGLRWRTHGKGNSVHEEIVSQTLFEGQWQAGTVWSGPFELELPAGPYTYHGHYLNVVWEVFARADIPWAIDPKTTHEIALRPDPDAEPDWATAVGSTNHLPIAFREKVGDQTTTPTAKSSGCTGNAFGIGCLLVIFSPVLFFLGAGVWRTVQFARGEISFGDVLPWMIIGLIALLVGLFIAFRVARNLVARKKLGAVTLRIDPELVRAGGKLNVSVSCKPAKATELLGATARIVATETVVRGSGTNKTTYREVVYEQDFEIAPARALPPGIPFQAGTSIPIPSEAPPSFYASSNKLAWEVTVRLDIARWPDWVEETEVLVHP